MRRLGVCGFLLLLLLFCALSSCQRTPENQSRITVVTSLFPLYDFARQVAGDRARVILLLPPGVEPHAFEPKPADMGRIVLADIFVFTGRTMEPWVDRIIAAVQRPELLVVDASKGVRLMAAEGVEHRHEGAHGHGGEGAPGRLDPHIWLDFDNARQMVGTIAAALAEKDPANKDYFAARAAEYSASLADLDGRYREGLSRCATRTFVHGGHYAFGYLARRYNLRYISAYQGSPDAEPTPRKLAAIVALMKKQGIRSVYYEELVTPRVADVLSRETGARLLRLHGTHNLSRDEFDRGATFLSLMGENLTSLQAGLECR